MTERTVTKNICKNCGKHIPKRKKFCDMNCRSEYGTVEVECSVCGKIEKIWKSRAKKYVACSKKCLGEYNKSENNVVCCICGTGFHLKKSKLEKIKTYPTCSVKCANELRTSTMTGENNHQYGLKGELNASFLSGRRIHCGYYWVYKPNHPMSINSGYVREHRYVASIELSEPIDAFEFIEGVKCIKQMYDVHHKDGNKLNNNPNNLQILTRAEHQKLHQSLKRSKKQNDK